MSDRAILYARISTGDKDTEASKLDAQLELCRDRAETVQSRKVIRL